MGLSDDQRAMLRLLAQREQGYEDIAALMGISVEQVRARVADALSQLEREGKEAPDVPAPPAAKAEPEESEEEPPAPESPPAPPKAEPSPKAPSVRKAPRPQLKLPSDPTVRAAIAAGVLVVALFGIILAINSSSGDSGSDTAGTTAAESTTGVEGEGETAANAGSRRLTKAVLEPVDGSEAAGVAVFGRVGKKLALQIEASGLEPTEKGTSYTLWLARSPQQMLPLAETAVPKSGKIAARFEVPVELIAYLATETFDQLVITRTDDARLNAALKDATQQKQTPSYTGTAVLAGTVTGPIVGIAKKAQSE